MRTQGGIGTGAEPVEIGEDDGPAEQSPTLVAPISEASARSAATAPGAVVQLRTLFDQQNLQAATIAEVRRDLEMLQTRVSGVEVPLAQHAQWFQGAVVEMSGLNNRMAGLQQAVHRNMRFAALELANAKRGPGDQPASVIRWAEAYLGFLDPPAPPQEPLQEEPARSIN